MIDSMRVRPSGHCGPVSRAHPRVGRYTPTPWGPPIERHAGRAWSREHLDQAAPPQGGAVGSGLRRCCLGVPAGPRVPQRAPIDWPRQIQQLTTLALADRPAHRPGAWRGTTATAVSSASAPPSSRSSRCSCCSVAGRSGTTSARARRLRLLRHRHRLLPPQRPTAPSPCFHS